MSDTGLAMSVVATARWASTPARAAPVAPTIPIDEERNASSRCEDVEKGAKSTQDNHVFRLTLFLELDPKRSSLSGGRANNSRRKMRNRDLRTMPVDALWELYEEVALELNRKMTAEKVRLEQRLHRLTTAGNETKPKHERRPYPKVLPKYRNPKNPAETWAGRGKQPHWVRAQLRAGKNLNDFLIEQSSA